MTFKNGDAYASQHRISQSTIRLEPSRRKIYPEGKSAIG